MTGVVLALLLAGVPSPPRSGGEGQDEGAAMRTASHPIPSPPRSGGEGQGEGAAVSLKSAPAASTLLAASDRSRGTLERGVTWTIDVESTEDGVVSRASYLVRARDADALVEAISPPRRKGEVMLFNDRNIWWVKPGLRRPIALAARQRLQGQAANGDIASTRYARDYDGVVVAEDDVGGEPAWRLELKARSKDVTYDRIRYWISKRRRLALKAEFLTVGGDVFKTAIVEYGNRVRLRGEEIDFVSRVTIRDAMGAGDVTVLDYRTPRADDHAPSLFNINNVVR